MAFGGLHEGSRDRATPRHQNQSDARQGVVETLHQARRVGGHEPARITQHDDPSVKEERRRGQGVDHHADFQLISTGAAVLLDHHGRVALAREVAK